MFKADDRYVHELLDVSLRGSGQQRARSVDVDICGGAQEVAKLETTTPGRRRVSGGMDDRVYVDDRLSHAVAGCQIALDPLDL